MRVVVGVHVGRGVDMASETITNIKIRVQDALDCTLTRSESLAVAVTASLPHDSEALSHILLSSMHAKRVIPKLADLALTESEWETVFGADCAANEQRSLHNSEVRALFGEPHVATILSNIESALCCSLVERRSRERWNVPMHKIAIYVALHSENAEQRICVSLKGLVRADSRRIDDVRANLEDAGSNTLLLCKSIICLSQCVS